MSERTEILAQFWRARQALLDAWICAIPHMTPLEQDQEQSATANSMAQLRLLEGGQ